MQLKFQQRWGGGGWEDDVVIYFDYDAMITMLMKLNFQIFSADDEDDERGSTVRQLRNFRNYYLNGEIVADNVKTHPSSTYLSPFNRYRYFIIVYPL